MSFIDDLISLKYSDFWKSISEALTIESILKFLVLYFIIVWIAVLVWVIKDITNRTSNIFLQLLSILIVLVFTPFWVFLYLLIRPWKTILEKYYQEIEDNLDTFSNIVTEKIKKEEENQQWHCFNCKKAVWYDFRYCPYCSEKLTKNCQKCKKYISISWNTCPFCWEKQEKK